MCGICGFFLTGPGDPEAMPRIVDAMASALRHRGPDDGGHWVDPNAGIALGHRRLSIIDLSAAGHQPMRSSCGRLVISYNGEIYNFRELRARLEQAGATFRGHSDTEVLLTAIAAWGLEATLSRLHGMFAVALWDRSARRLSLARDRVGKKPLYYGWCGDAFLFASELKALHRHPAFAPEIDRDALGLLIQHGWIPAPYTIYRGIRKLPAGATLTLDTIDGRGEAHIASYWSANAVAEAGSRQPFAGSYDDAVGALDDALGAAVEARMIADVPLGALLSGGVDSTAVVAQMQARTINRVRTFAIGFHEPKHDEAPYAKAIAQHLGTDHTELYIGPEDSLALIPELPAMYDEPLADPSQIPTALVCRLARQHVTVALSGDGGDELFAGYHRYQRTLASWRRYRRWPLGARRAAEVAAKTLRRGAAGHRWLTRIEKRTAGLGAADPLDLFVRERTRAAPGQLVVGTGPVPHLLAERASWPTIREPLQTMMVLDFAGWLADDGLVKVDRASMAASLEVRCPLLDHRVVELAWSLPLQMRVNAEGSKRVLKSVLERYVPRALFERPKRGFGLPIANWLRGPLVDWAEALLDPARLSREGFLQTSAVRELWEEHRSGRRNRHEVLWHLLTFQAWHEHWHGSARTLAEAQASDPLRRVAQR